jgi:hypothetical protein
MTDQDPNPTISPPPAAPEAGVSGAFTPGPWRYDRGAGCRSIKGRKVGSHKQAQYLTEVACTPGLRNDAEDLANAQLIAAAPDLLEALRRIALGSPDDKPPFRAMGPSQMQAVASAAIAKAIGAPR